MATEESKPWTLAMEKAYVREAKACLRKSAENHQSLEMEGCEEVNLSLDKAALEDWLQGLGIFSERSEIFDPRETGLPDGDKV